jgi:cell wall-associated NlpC family hydrolase
VLASLLASIVGFSPAPAAAITRTEVLTRAHSWVIERVIYSQRAYFAGYRRDCSGFVSMAWHLKTSYTSRSIDAVAKRIPLSRLRPGDAVHTPGHVALFVRWQSKAKRTYVAMEESLRGRPAMHHVRSLGSDAIALRYRRIVDMPAIIAVSAPSIETTPIVAVATVSGW